MSASFQSLAALGVVALAVGGLVWRALARRNRPGCGGDCGCATDKLKIKAK